MRLYVILVEPEKPINLGLIARLCENFEVDELRVVSPRFPDGGWRTARIFASHASWRISQAKIYRSLSEALNGVECSVATSSIYRVAGPNISRRAMGLKEFFEMVSEIDLKSLGVVFGRETSGLRRDEIERCDTLLTIEASEGYQTLNIACAASIILHAIYLARGKKKLRVLAERELRERLVKYFEEIVREILKDERREKMVVRAFTNILNRGAPDHRETTLLVGVLRRVLRKIR